MISTHRIASLTCLGIALALACSPAAGPSDKGPGGDGDGDETPITDEDDNSTIDFPGEDDLNVEEQPATDNCGDGTLDDDEACDDGNMVSDDGCGANCRYVEQGWVCPTAGEACRAFAKCGDGIPVFPEQCDDGNPTPGDGCSEYCKLEIGYQCSGSPSTCTETVCGNGGEPEGAETCDDGNGLPFDGCSEICQGEPVCTTEGCTTTCGDGLRIGDEECDDGNGTSGDGCSSTCQVEPGYECEQMSTCPEGEEDCPLQLPIVFRDFNVSHPDFHAPDPIGADSDDRPCDGFSEGIVESTLDENGKPIYRSSPPKSCVSPEGFAQWYVDTDESSTILSNITLYANGNGGYVNRFGDNGEPYTTVVETPEEEHTGAASLAACEESCATRAENAQAPFVGQGQLHCQPLCNPETQEITTVRNTQLIPAQNALNQAENDPDTTDEELEELEAAVAAAEEAVAEAQQAEEDCLTDCQDQIDERTEVCAAQCNPCSDDADQYCIGGEVVELDGDPLFFPIDDHPDAKMDARSAARIPAQIYEGRFWPWEDASCDGGQLCPGPEHNFHFTSEIAYWFKYEEGMQADLTFIGDDDVWVFVNRKLVIDLGGIHVPLGGRFNLNGGAVTTRTWQSPAAGEDDEVEVELSSATMMAGDLGLVPGNVYEIKVFHAERKPEGSSFQLTLSGFEASRSVCIPECGDGILASGEQCDNGDENTVEPTYNGCTTECRLGTYCGDGQVQSEEGEQCDDADPEAPEGCAGCRLLIIK